MKIETLKINQLSTERLILTSFTKKICQNILNNDFSDVFKMGLKKGKNWPDHDVIDTLPRIINNLSRVHSPTGFESWMIIKNDTMEIIGDVGFKGFHSETANVDLGYGIIKEERKKGYAEESATAIIKWAFSTDTVKKITAACLFNNVGSIHLLKKLNFTEIKKENDMVYWALPKNKSATTPSDL